jgi:hypothetical protein
MSQQLEIGIIRSTVIGGNPRLSAAGHLGGGHAPRTALTANTDPKSTPFTAPVRIRFFAPAELGQACRKIGQPVTPAKRTLHKSAQIDEAVTSSPVQDVRSANRHHPANRNPENLPDLSPRPVPNGFVLPIAAHSANEIAKTRPTCHLTTSLHGFVLPPALLTSPVGLAMGSFLRTAARPARDPKNGATLTSPPVLLWVRFCDCPGRKNREIRHLPLPPTDAPGPSMNPTPSTMWYIRTLSGSNGLNYVRLLITQIQPGTTSRHHVYFRFRWDTRRSPLDRRRQVMPDVTTETCLVFGAGGHARVVLDILRTATTLVECALVDSDTARGPKVTVC